MAVKKSFIVQGHGVRGSGWKRTQDLEMTKEPNPKVEKLGTKQLFGPVFFGGPGYNKRQLKFFFFSERQKGKLAL